MSLVLIIDLLATVCAHWAIWGAKLRRAVQPAVTAKIQKNFKENFFKQNSRYKLESRGVIEKVTAHPTLPRAWREAGTEGR
jgi:hypothetical protein